MKKEEPKVLELKDNQAAIITQRKFEIDFSKVTELSDIIKVLKGMNITIWWYQEECPEQFKELYEGGYLKEVEKEWQK